MEKALYIEGNTRLFGMLFCPEPEYRKSTGFVVIHPFAEEKKSAHRTLVDLSRQLYRQGFPVLMFDLRGCGDSEGDFATVRLAEWLNDIETAVNILKLHTQLPNVGIIGLRFGAFLSICYAAKHPDISEYIWIEPVWQPVSYLRKSLRHKLMKELCTEGVVASNRDNLLQDLQHNTSIDFDGYEIGADLYRDLATMQKELSIAGCLKNIRKSLLVSVSMNGKISKSTQEFYSLKPEMEQINITMDLFWNKIEDTDHEELIMKISNYVLTI